MGMLTAHTALLLSGLLLISILVEPFAKKIHLPFAIVLVIVGFIGSEVVTKLVGVDTGIRWDNVGKIVFYLILPALIFYAAFSINIKCLLENSVLIGLLALPLMLVVAATTATFLFYGIDHPGFPWHAALITGVLLSATDPSAVLSSLKASSIPDFIREKLSMLLEGESLFSDATAVLMFSILLASATHATALSEVGVATIFLRFLTTLFGGLGVGIVVAAAACLIMRTKTSLYLSPVASIVCAYAAFFIAEAQLQVSGVMAVLAAGLVVGEFNRRYMPVTEHNFTATLWRFLVYIAEAMIFLLAGITITLAMFVDQWFAISLGIVAIVVARAMMIFCTLPIINTLVLRSVSLKQQIVLVWGGTRGTVTLALALSLPLNLSYWYTIQSIAYGVVLFTLFFQATTMTPLIRKLNIV